MTFDEVLDALHAWVSRKKTEYSPEMTFEIVRDTDDCLRVIFETKNSLSELLVNEPGFAPYRWVSFQVMSIDRPPESGPVYVYYGDGSSTIPDIVRGLDKGIEKAFL